MLLFLTRLPETLRRSHDRLMPLLAIVLLCGVMFRMYHLDLKYYQHDETITALRISGHTEAELIQDVVRHPGITLGEIHDRYQVYTPTRSIGHTLQGLAQEEPQLTPLYYGMAHYWAGVFGSDRGTVRQLSLLLNILAMPLLVWLGWELFGSWQAPWIALVLFAVSPFHTLMAQQARHYSLWTVTTLLCSVALLRALRRDRPWDWLAYGMSLALSFYSCLLTVLVAAGHGLYVLLLLQKHRASSSDSPRPWGLLGRYLAASIGALLLFLPWAMILIQNWSRVRQATGVVVTATQAKREIASWPKLIEGWLRLPGRLFYDANIWDGSSPVAELSQSVMFAIGLSLLVYAIYRLCRSYDRRISLFLMTSAILPWAGLVVQDRVLGVRGGEGSITVMYLTPTLLAIGLIVTAALAYHLRPQAKPGLGRLLGQLALVILLSAGLYSNLLIAQSDWWVNQGFAPKVLQQRATAQLINQSDRPLLVSDPESWDLLFFSHLLKPETQVVMNPRCGLCTIPNQPGWRPDLSDRPNSLFAFPTPSTELRQTLEDSSGYELEPLLLSAFEPHLYRLRPATTPLGSSAPGLVSPSPRPTRP